MNLAGLAVANRAYSDGLNGHGNHQSEYTDKDEVRTYLVNYQQGCKAHDAKQSNNQVH